MTTTLTPQEVLARSMSEAVLLAHVRDAVKKLGGICYHTHDSRRSEAGFFDLVIVTAAGSLLFRELKSEKGKLSDEQEEWWRQLVRANADAGVWRPTHWLNGTIERELQDVVRVDDILKEHQS